MEDAQQTIDLVDRYEGGLVTQDEIVSLQNFKNLAETFYSPQMWLHGQMRQHELRLKDEDVLPAHCSIPKSSTAFSLTRNLTVPNWLLLRPLSHCSLNRMVWWPMQTILRRQMQTTVRDLFLPKITALPLARCEV